LKSDWYFSPKIPNNNFVYALRVYKNFEKLHSLKY
jgi:hypothetical protein